LLFRRNTVVTSVPYHVDPKGPKVPGIGVPADWEAQQPSPAAEGSAHVEATAPEAPPEPVGRAPAD